jgi:hypothetical protein
MTEVQSLGSLTAADRDIMHLCMKLICNIRPTLNWKEEGSGRSHDKVEELNSVSLAIRRLLC